VHRLVELRQRIDEIDEQLVVLLNQRAAQALTIGRIKHEAGEAVYQPAREAEVLAPGRQNNAGPRDEANQMGPYEASLVGNPVADPEKPLEVLRTVQSFDPCLACAIHVVATLGPDMVRAKAWRPPPRKGARRGGRMAITGVK